MLTVPTFDAAGQATGLPVPMPNCASVHPTRPVAAAGLSVSPGGSVTTASLTCALSRPSGFSGCGTCRLTDGPTGLSCCVVSGVTPIDGAKGTWLQPVAPLCVSDVAVFVSPAEETTVSFVVWMPAQRGGRGVKGVPRAAPPVGVGGGAVED